MCQATVRQPPGAGEERLGGRGEGAECNTEKTAAGRREKAKKRERKREREAGMKGRGERRLGKRSAWRAQSLEYATPDLGIVSLSPTLGAEIAGKKELYKL